MIDDLTGNLARNRANQQEAGMHQQYLGALQPYIDALQNGGAPQPGAALQGGVGNAAPQAGGDAVAEGPSVPLPRPNPMAFAGNEPPQSGMFGGTSRPADWPQQP